MIGEIRRGADDGNPDVRPDPDCDHVLFDDVAEADAGVDPVRDDVGQVVVDDHIHLDVGMRRKESWQHRHHHGRDRVLGRRDADGAGRFPAQGANRVHPASVVDTERVVRDSSRTPSRSSKVFMAWLNADWDMPSSAAARVKLPCFATTAKAARSYRSSRFIYAPDT